MQFIKRIAKSLWPLEFVVAFQTSMGRMSAFIARLLNEHPAEKWTEWKTQLNFRFAEIVDTQHAFDLLNKIKQKSKKNVQIFRELLVTLKVEAFSGQECINQIFWTVLSTKDGVLTLTYKHTTRLPMVSHFFVQVLYSTNLEPILTLLCLRSC